MMDKGSDGKLMPINTFKNIFLRATMEQLAKDIDKSVLLQTSNKTSICSIRIQLNVNKAKQILCSSRKSSSFTRIPDIEMLDILSVKCSTIDLQMQIQMIKKKITDRKEFHENKDSNPNTVVTNKNK